MDLNKKLNELEDRYYGELEENKEVIVEEVFAFQQEFAKEDETAFNKFFLAVIDRLGGTYIPYVFWDKLGSFMSFPNEQRPYLFDAIQAFANSDFEEREQKLMKPLLVTYFATEKEFEVKKIKVLIADKAHPKVKEYLYKLFDFTEKNESATQTYIEKFRLLKDMYPSFPLLQLPLIHLKEKLGIVEEKEEEAK